MSSHPDPWTEVVPLDGGHVVVTVHPAAADGPVALLVPAMGVRASYYEPFAARLAANGLTVMVADLRGQGASLPPAGRETDHGFTDVIEHDIPVLVAHLAGRFPAREVWIIGHSLGGQLALVSAAYARFPVAGVVLIACGSAWFRAHPGWRSARHLVMGVLFAAIARALGYWPGDMLGFGGRQSARLMIDCARQTVTGRYTTPHATGDYDAALAAARLTMLVIDIDGDRLTPPTSTSHLCAKAAAATVTRCMYRGAGSRIRTAAHFSWVRSSPGLAEDIAAWVIRG